MKCHHEHDYLASFNRRTFCLGKRNGDLNKFNVKWRRKLFTTKVFKLKKLLPNDYVKHLRLLVMCNAHLQMETFTIKNNLGIIRLSTTTSSLNKPVSWRLWRTQISNKAIRSYLDSVRVLTRKNSDEHLLTYDNKKLFYHFAFSLLMILTCALFVCANAAVPNLKATLVAHNSL